MRHGLNLCAVFREGDLIYSTTACECEVTRHTAPESQECSCRGAALCRSCLSAALHWALLLRLSIGIWRVIGAIFIIGAFTCVAIISTRNQNRACVGDKRTELAESHVWWGCGEVKNLSSNLRV
jgi:hypothetical protein